MQENNALILGRMNRYYTNIIIKVKDGQTKKQRERLVYYIYGEWGVLMA